MPLTKEDADPTRFCTGHSLASGEPLAGWGGHQERNILIRWPKARWRHSLRIADGMPDALVEAIEGAVAAGWRVNLIDRKGDVGPATRVLLFPASQVFDVSPVSLPSLINAIATGDALDEWNPLGHRAQTILVCTHGRHDKCCAKWGFAAYKAIAAASENHSGAFDVWEITHLGGCRMAGGALVLPAGRKYGRLVPADAGPMLAAEVKGQPYLPAFRGTNRYDAPMQVAEIALREHVARPIHALALREVGASKEVRRFVAETEVGHFEITCTSELLTSYGACSDLADGAPLKPKTIWRGCVSVMRNAPGEPMTLIKRNQA